MFTKFGFGEIILHTYMGREGLGSSYWTAWLRQVHSYQRWTLQEINTTIIKVTFIYMCATPEIKTLTTK
jgi:hypothetical protein